MRNVGMEVIWEEQGDLKERELVEKGSIEDWENVGG